MDFRLRLDGALDEIYEPLWKLQIQLTEAEMALLRSKKVRRLHFIRLKVDKHSIFRNTDFAYPLVHVTVK